MKCSQCGCKTVERERFVEYNGLEYSQGLYNCCMKCDHAEKVKA